MLLPAYIAYILLRVFIRTVKGIDRLPKKAYILVANHCSFIDGPLLTAVIAWHTGRIPRFVIAEDQFGGPLRRWFLLNVMHQISKGNAVRQGLAALKKGDIVGLFPEGGRTDTGSIVHTAFTGTGVLAHLSGKPVVPVAIHGTFAFWSRFHTLPTFRRCIRVEVGKPMRFARREKRVPRPVARNAVTRVMQSLGKMLGQSYPLRQRKGPMPWEKQ